MKNQLKELIQKAVIEKVLTVYQIPDVGGIVCLENKEQVFYLKGAVDAESKKNGGMYLAINSAICEALEKEKAFDFGGSKVDGVKRFNFNLGGSDSVYYNYSNSNYPWWYKALKRILKK